MHKDTIRLYAIRNKKTTGGHNAARFSEIETEVPGDSESLIKSIFDFYGLIIIISVSMLS